ncbi:hypothetical protein Nhal_2264 [Nitrosococcus halophilus Nc 4]|uniref:DUF1902 domain-containing protein n=1 Tax=Nitrosococcus halophilus (strain Nc4) TaxID=472759 RepID=D5BV02_NITHN|nr:hypothetical protein [Nitrosococcus halophilus]ADE15352.1 hypothetical protein Nhal_2264 [Nitrosococcus halophilus Nc 4]
MRPQALFLRCFVERRDDQWQGFCIDLNLAAQGDSLEEVKRKLEAMIADYVYDALAGEDREYAMQLMQRKAPLSIRWRYCCYASISRVVHWKREIYRVFQEQVPLFPRDPHHHPMNHA